MLSLRGLEQASAISSLCFVILSVTKDLKACTTVHRHGDLEILHCVQNDSVYSVIVSTLCHPECNEGSPRLLHAINAGCRLSALRRFFTAFRMTAYSVQNDRVRHHYATRRVTKYGAHSETYNSIFIFFCLYVSVAI